MPRRKTKDQREAEARRALGQRLLDMYCGANHGQMGADDEVFADVLAVVVPLIRDTFGEPETDWYGFKVHCVDKFASPQRACDFLFERGFRADKPWGPSEVGP